MELKLEARTVGTGPVSFWIIEGAGGVENYTWGWEVVCVCVCVQVQFQSAVLATVPYFCLHLHLVAQAVTSFGVPTLPCPTPIPPSLPELV